MGEVCPRQVVHLGDGGDHSAFAWGSYAANGNPPKADYSYDSLTETETFKLYGRSSNRSENRHYNEYRTGSRQFEGYVTFFPPPWTTNP